MKSDFEAYRRQELQSTLPTRETVGFRVPVIMRKRLKSKALELGTTEGQLLRFLTIKALEDYGVKALECF
jgi:hypothetical protein